MIYNHGGLPHYDIVYGYMYLSESTLSLVAHITDTNFNKKESGAEKVQKEVNKKELEQNDSRISLKVRLTEKKARVADYGKELQKNQKITREI